MESRRTDRKQLGRKGIIEKQTERDPSLRETLLMANFIGFMGLMLVTQLGFAFVGLLTAGAWFVYELDQSDKREVIIEVIEVFGNEAV